MKFSLVHPSRARLLMAETAIVEWMTKASGEHEIEYILSVDDDDPHLAGYRALASKHGTDLVVNGNHSLIEATNSGARKATGDVVLGLSDDFGCPDHWDTALAEVLGERRDVGVLVHDGITGNLMTLPILGRDLYQQLGYVFYPGYRHWYCDNDIQEACRVRGKLVDATHLLFPHRHFSVGLAEIDAEYMRHERSKFAGLRILEKRRAARFGLREPSLALRLHEVLIDVKHALRTATRLTRAGVRTARQQGAGAALRKARRIARRRP